MKMYNVYFEGFFKFPFLGFNKEEVKKTVARVYNLDFKKITVEGD